MKRERFQLLVRLLPRESSFPVKFEGFTFLGIEELFLTLVKKSPLVSIQHTAKGIFQPLVQEDNDKI